MGQKNVYISEELYKAFSSLDEYLQTITKSHLDKNGHEVPNPKPLVAYTGLNKPLSMKEEIARILSHSRFANEMRRQGQETEEEANDFNVGDDMVDPNYNSKYTVMHDEEPPQRRTQDPLPETEEEPTLSPDQEEPTTDPEPDV